MSTTATEERNESKSFGSIIGAPVVLLATDGTSQSDPAVAFVRELAERRSIDVRVITVVNHLPIPFGDADLQLMAEIEQDMQRDVRATVAAQLSGRGVASWPVIVETGEPAERISSVAASINAFLIVVGLGSHGVASRLFGSETAMRLVRISQAPVLAIAPALQPAPRRIVVAMDFSEASIEAARLALEFADRKATVVLAHCIPWGRSEHVPEQWFRSHEAAIAAELTRVTRWLDSEKKFRISHRVLYGKAPAKLLSYAADLEADLIVAGTHGRSLLGRVLAGQTVTKLIRGAHCSVLVLPAAAAFKFSDRLPDSAATVGDKDWSSALTEFSRNNAGRRARLEIDDVDLGAQTEMSGYKFQGAAYEPASGRATLMFGTGSAGGSHLERGISNIKSIEILASQKTGVDLALAIGHDGGKTLLVFDVPQNASPEQRWR